MKLWLWRTRALTALGVLGVSGCGSSEDGLESASFGLGSADLVISQVYGGGGNSGSKYKNDFIELFNRGSTRGQRVRLVGAIRRRRAARPGASRRSAGPFNPGTTTW